MTYIRGLTEAFYEIQRNISDRNLEEIANDFKHKFMHEWKWIIISIKSWPFIQTSIAKTASIWLTKVQYLSKFTNFKYTNFFVTSIILLHHLFVFRKYNNTEGSPYNVPILGLRPANETLLQSNAVSHWLGASLESALNIGNVGYNFSSMT